VTHLPHHFDCDECHKKGTLATPCLAEHACFEDLETRRFRFHASRQAKADVANASEYRAICARRDHFLEALKGSTVRADRVYVYHPAGPTTAHDASPPWVLTDGKAALILAGANARACVCDGVIVEVGDLESKLDPLRFGLDGATFTFTDGELRHDPIGQGAETDPREIAARRHFVLGVAHDVIRTVQKKIGEERR